MFKRRSVQHVINIVVMVLCVAVFFAGTSVATHLQETKPEIKKSIENEWRTQARRTLQNLQFMLDYDIKAGTVDPYNELSLQDWAKKNVSGILNGGPTGDIFIVNLSNEKFIWDGSPDCAKPEFITNGRYLKDEPSLHYDADRANYTIDRMKMGYSTDETSNEWWNFDSSPELLEWITYPPGSLGLDNEPYSQGGIKNPKYTKLLIVLGTQQDEIYSTFNSSFEDIDNNVLKIKTITYVIIIMCLFNMSIYVYFNKRLN